MNIPPFDRRMRMSIQNEMPGYKDVDQLLNQQGSRADPGRDARSDHSGITVRRQQRTAAWQPLVHDLTNEGLAFGHELAEALRNMHAAIERLPG